MTTVALDGSVKKSQEPGTNIDLLITLGFYVNIGIIYLHVAAIDTVV
jgi:hypothetical protein